MKVQLVMFKQDGQRRDFELKRESATIGRNVDCDFQIPLEVISRRHTQIFTKGDKLFARDLGSSNGTFVNNKRIQESELNAGDTLTIGPVIFTIVVDGEPAEVKPVRTIVGAEQAPAKEAPKSDTGTVDVDHAEEVEEVAVTAKAADAEEVEEVEEVDEEDVEEVEEVEEEETSGGDNPLSALEALSKKKKP